MASWHWRLLTPTIADRQYVRFQCKGLLPPDKSIAIRSKRTENKNCDQNREQERHRSREWDWDGTRNKKRDRDHSRRRFIRLTPANKYRHAEVSTINFID
ncbi:hypothetical protein EVAR_61783_1 [Eumeta japonica]|uniref:Uncharacterized protein n=1 Tax=Eumeta variegata TaxID=151549 RepID=A0A4C1Z432_EUMVA|nr:hypothetical protein EVAR_61783_1 [Eumeta japonica]